MIAKAASSSNIFFFVCNFAVSDFLFLFQNLVFSEHQNFKLNI